MKGILLIVSLVYCFILNSKICIAQNIIINSDFEDTSQASIFAAQTYKQVNLNFFYGYLTFGRGITPPTLEVKTYFKNNLSRMARSGRAAGGGLFYKVNGTKGCLVMRFVDSLIKDETYVFEIYIKHAAGSFALNNLDIALADLDFYYHINGSKKMDVPSLLNLNRLKTYLVDSSFSNNKWEKIKIEFVAKGTEKSIVIGCFGYPKKFLKKSIDSQIDSLKGEYAVYLFDDALLMSKQDYKIWEYENEITPKSIFFDFDSKSISNLSKLKLDSLANYLRINPSLSITLIGYTDPFGIEKHNEKLALQRANITMNYLTSKGIYRNQIFIKGQVYDFPKGFTLPMEKYFLFRRVEFVIH